MSGIEEEAEWVETDDPDIPEDGTAPTPITEEPADDDVGEPSDTEENPDA